tara:strand:- start:677 stop:1117 length:441 start_codon:yes stop_codon:yes gene_type:complete
MPLNYPFAGAGDVASYQMSAVPFVTSSNGAEATNTPVRVAFPNVTRFIVVHETAGQDLRIAFTRNGVKGTGASVSGSAEEQRADHSNYFVLKANETTPRMEVRCKEIFFQRNGGSNAGFSIIAGITPIPERNFPLLSGSEGYLGVG